MISPKISTGLGTKWAFVIYLLKEWTEEVREGLVNLPLTGGSDGNESACQCRRPGFDPWIRKIPSRRKWQHAPVVLPGENPWTKEPGGLQSMGSQRVGVRHDLVTNTGFAVLPADILITVRFENSSILYFSYVRIDHSFEQCWSK